MADHVAISVWTLTQQHPRIKLIIPCSCSISSRYVSLPVSSFKLPFSQPSPRSHAMLMTMYCSQPNSNSLIATHEHTDGSLIFRFGDSSEVVEKVEEVAENSVSGGSDDSGLVSGNNGKEDAVVGSDDDDAKENDEKQKKNVKSRTRRRKKSKMVEASGLAEDSNDKSVGVKAEIDEGRAEEMRMSSPVGSDAGMEEGTEAPKVCFVKDDLEELSSPVAVSELESRVNVEKEIALDVVLEEKSGSEEATAHLPSSVVNSEIDILGAREGSEEETKAEVQNVTIIVEADKDDKSDKEIINNYASKDTGRGTDEVEAVQMSEVVQDGITDTQPIVTNEGVDVETLQMSMIKDGFTDEKKRDVANEVVNVGTTRMSKTLQDSITNEDVDMETTQMPKSLEDDIVVGKQPDFTHKDLEVETAQMPRTQEDGIAVGKQIEDAEVEITPMPKVEEDDIVTGKQQIAELETTVMLNTEEDGIVSEKQPNLTNEDAPNVTSQDAEVETTPMPKTEEDDIVVGKQPYISNEDVDVRTTQVPKTQEDDIIVGKQPSFTGADAEVGNVHISTARGVVGKQPNSTNEEVEVDTTQMSKPLEDEINAGKGLMGTHEDVNERDEVELMPVPPIKEAEPILDEETTPEALDESFKTDSTGSLKLVDDGALNLKREEELIQYEEENSNSPNLSTLQDEELQSTTAILFREQDVAERLFLSSSAASLRHTSEVLAGREDAYFVCDNWLGVADGVGHWAPDGTKVGLYAQQLMENCKKIVTERKSSPVSKPDDVLLRAVAETDSPGSSTLLVSHFDGQALHVANIGDSGFILIRNGVVYAKSSPMHHDFNFPVHFGSDDDPSKLMERYKFYLEEGDVIVTATDGLFDNLYEKEVALLVTRSLQGKLKAEEIAQLLVSSAQVVGQSTTARSPFADAAQAAGYVGYTGGKHDDITVIVSIVQ